MVGTWRVGRLDDTPHGGFYTQDDLREIVAYGQARGITVVPEIDVPGHSQAAIAAYPELGMPDGPTEVGVTWGIIDAVLNPSPATVDFYREVLDAVLDVFPSQVVHLGGDEVPLGPWQAAPELARQAADLGLAGVGDLHGWFVGQLAEHLVARGRRPAVWDEALSPALPASSIVTAWQSAARGSRALEAGHDIVLAPEQHLYLDHRSSDGPDEPVPVGFVRTVEDVYAYEPVVPGGPGQVLGTQAQLWTEHLDSGRRIDFAAFPRLAAFAEVAWTAPERRDHDRLRPQAPRAPPAAAGRGRRRVPPARRTAAVAAPPGRGRARPRPRDGGAAELGHVRERWCVYRWIRASAGKAPVRDSYPAYRADRQRRQAASGPPRYVANVS